MRANRSSKDVIFDSALGLFAEQGYFVVSMRQIAKASNIAVASIYNHFPSKQDILDEVYRFYAYNMERLRPNLEELLALLPGTPPRQVMRQTSFAYPGDILTRMAQATAVVISLVQHDQTADELMNRYLIELPTQYDIPLLNRMMELELIEPIDPARFSTLHSNYHLAAAVRHFTHHALSDKEWMEGLDLLFDLIQPRQT